MNDPGDHAGEDIPPEAGRRARVAPNGEVHGSGASAGGGNVGEEYDNDEHGGERALGSGTAPSPRPAPGQGAGDHEVGELKR